MATRTKSRTSNRSSSQSSKRSDQGASSAFSWGENAGPLIGAALAGAAIGLAANYGRKFAMQGMEAAAGDWDEMLASDHDKVLALFDQMLATDETQTWKRSAMLMKLGYALDKHAYEEESVVYPALRDANEGVTADELNQEHGQVKTFLFELKQLEADAPNWLETVRQFRDLIAEHARMEEQEVFPRFKKSMTEEQNAKITAMVNKAGFAMA